MEALSPGEYLVTLNLGRLQEGTTALGYLSWDGQAAGDLFHLDSSRADDELGSLLFASAGRLWFHVGNGSALFMIEIPSARAGQFAFEPECDAYLRPNHFGTEYFLLGCFNSSDTDRYYHSVSLADFRIAGSWKYHEGVRIQAWASPDRLDLSRPWKPDATSFQYCSVQSPQWTVSCGEMPFEVGETDPTGTWTWVAPPTKDSTGFSSAFPIAVVPRSCIDQGGACDPRVVFPAEWRGRYRAEETRTSWSPDGRTLVVVDLNVHQCNEAWVWSYDTETERARGLVRLDDCYDFFFGEAIWSQDGQRFIISRTGAEEKTIVVSLDGSTFLLPTTDFVATSFVVP